MSYVVVPIVVFTRAAADWRLYMRNDRNIQWQAQLHNFRKHSHEGIERSTASVERSLVHLNLRSAVLRLVPILKLARPLCLYAIRRKRLRLD